MTKISTQSITCPKCQHHGEFKMYETVNVSLDESLREKVFSNELFKWECPECGEVITILYPFLYHDMDHEFMIYFSPVDCENYNEQFHSLLTKCPGMRSTKHRTVNTLNSLKEKVLIFESGLNDIAIELAKVLIKSNDKKKPEYSSLLFADFIHSKESEKKDILIFKTLVDDKPQKGMSIMTREQYELYVNIVEKDFQMTRYCETIDEKWILQRLAQLE